MFSKSTIKYIQSLQHKKFRDEHNVFVAEGPKVVSELLQSGFFNCKAIYAIDEWVATNNKVTERYHDRIETIRDFELEKIAHYSTANKVVALFEKRSAREDIEVKNRITVALDEIQDPGNLGTIIRTADWFGIENIVCSANTADLYNPKVIQSTMASAGKVNVLYTDLKRWLERIEAVPILAATLSGKQLHELPAMKEAVIVIGNESKGVSDGILHVVNGQVTIPKYGSAESLNAAVATAIILYAIRRIG